MSMERTSVVGFLRERRRGILRFTAVCCVLVLGHHIPVAGVLSDAIDAYSQQQLGNISIFSAGFSSWFTAWVLFQIYGLITHRFMSLRAGTATVVNPLDVKVLLVTLVLASFAWFGMLGSIVPIYTGSPLSTGQMLTGLVSGLAGVCTLIYLGRLLDQVAPGFGFWILLACSSLYGFGLSILPEMEFLLTGALSRNLAFVSLLLLLLCLVSAVFLVRETIETSVLSAPMIFASLLLSSVVAQWLTPFVFVPLEPVLPGFVGVLPDVVVEQAYRCIAVLIEIVFVLVFTSVFARRDTRVVWRWDVAAAFVILLFSVELNILLGGLMWSQLTPLVWLILTWAALKILTDFRNHRGPEVVLKSKDEDLFDADFRRGWR
jgi:hypothetical protein